MTLNKDQSRALSLVLQGHNIIIMGSAGTGKTFCVKTIINELKRRKKTVAVTASTGIACLLHENAMTIHKWSGIGDGRFSPDILRNVICKNVHYRDVCERIKNTDILVVDECSMVSKRVFNSLNELFQLKNKEYLFGGIQMVFCGEGTLNNYLNSSKQIFFMDPTIGSRTFSAAMSTALETSSGKLKLN